MKKTRPGSSAESESRVQTERDAQGYSRLADAMSDAAFVVDLNGRFLEVNTAAVESYGYSRAELLTMGPADLNHEGDRELIARGIEELRSIKRRVFETFHRSKDGRVFPVEVSISYTTFDDQPAFLSLVRDISVRKQAEEGLRSLKERYQAILQTVPEIIAEVDEDKIYTWMNETGLRFFGEGAIGKTADAFFEGEQDTYTVVQPLFEGETDTTYVESWQRRRDGEKRLLAWWCRALRAEDGQVTGALSTARDVTERWQMERMREARLHLMELAVSTSLDDFLAATLRELELLTESPVAFCSFFALDESTVTAEAWATSDSALSRSSAGEDTDKDDARDLGVWIRSMQERHPVIHNDLLNLLGREGAPPRHLELTRAITVPVLRGDKVVAEFAVGNKVEEYTDRDMEAAANLCDLAWDIAARKQTETALMESDAWNRRLFDAAPDAIILSEAGGRFLDCNQTTIDRYGYSREELLQMSYKDLAAFELRESAGSHVKETFDLGGTVFEWRHRRKDGTELPVEIRTVPFVSKGQKRILATVRDLTESKEAQEEQERLQAQLRQAAKMESIGRLAGGVAHDFNNMLAVILGHVELALAQVDPKKPLYSDLQEIRNAADRSAGITQQLLAFARRQVSAPKKIDLNEAVEGMLAMLRRLIGEHIELVWSPSEVDPVEIDPSQLDQVLVNLCLNSRDAIVEAGKVTIVTSRVTLDQDYCDDHEGCLPGDYILLSVSDDGSGMSDDALHHLFEPFYTTKETGKGTGLGLATVYGIVKQNNGFIQVESDQEMGTDVRIYLPRASERPAAGTSPSSHKVASGGTETLLLVEDEPAVLQLTDRILSELEYEVLTARTPTEALRIAEKHDGPISLAMTDLVMPGMNGWVLSEHLRDLRPDIKILYVSGYADDRIANRDSRAEGVEILQKPFTPQELAARVRLALDQD